MGVLTVGVPKPRRDGKNWVVDLRSQGFPSPKYVIGPASLTDIEAIYAAFAKLEELRGQRLAEPHAQLELTAGAPRTLAGAIDAWRALKRVKKDESRRYVKSQAARLMRDLGSYALRDFVDGGQARITAYADGLTAGGKAARTVRNMLATLKEVLRFCANPERRWLPFVAEFPERPALPSPLYRWIEEPLFRFLRGALYAPGAELDALVAWLARPENRRLGPAEHFVARRRVYLSWLFYTGVRKHDADELTADDASLDVGVYVRRARKTDAVPMQYPMPEPLVDDLREYLAVVGREFFLPGEPIGGGRWANVARLVQRARRAAGITVDITPMIFRRSFARQMFVLGLEVREVAEMMGHVDTRMLDEIYAKVPRPPGAARTAWKRNVSRAPQGSAPARTVVPFSRHET